jgi:hypothetical protein
MENILNKAILSVQRSEISFCKFLSNNDTKATKANQSGYLISISAWSLFLDTQPTEHILKSKATIKWQDDFETPAIFTFYDSKGELRLTGFGRGFPFREEDNVGDLFILVKKSTDYFEAFILKSDEDIEDFFSAINISATETNKIIPKQFEQTSDSKLLYCFQNYIRSLKVSFPTTLELSSNARSCYNTVHLINQKIIERNPDDIILKWLTSEYDLFKLIENDRYSETIKEPFKNVEELIKIANTILQRRKSRAGSSLEHHLCEIFNNFPLMYSSQKKTEGSKQPDFLFPAAENYHNKLFDEKKLTMLAAKTTCKDRWRQILNEADRIKNKHLFTLQQGISATQLEEMYRHNVILVVPRENLKMFPDKFKNEIWTLDRFIKFRLALQ